MKEWDQAYLSKSQDRRFDPYTRATFMGKRPRKVSDDRGNALTGPRNLLGAIVESNVSAAERTLLERHVRGGFKGTIWSVIARYLLLFFAVSFGWRVGMQAMSSGIQSVSPIDWIFAGLWVFVVVGAFRRFGHIVTSVNLAPVLWELRRCVACAHSRRDIPHEPDGCTICPECGAAWRLPPPVPELQRRDV